MFHADLILAHAGQLITCSGRAPRTGAAQGVAPALADGAVASLDGRIVFAGTASELERQVAPIPGAVRFDAGGRTIVPGFVDAHTHALFAGDRRGELQQRLAG